MKISTRDIALMIDHSLLNPVLTDKDLIEGIELAKEFSVISICIKPYFVKRAAQLLDGTGIRNTTVIGFPHGSHTTEVKSQEALGAIRDGAQELDMVVNIGKVLSGDWEYVREDIRAVLGNCREGGALLKVIFENCYLESDHIRKLCEISSELRVDFVKTSTGFGSGGAEDADLKIMRQYTDPDIQIKAAGKVRTLDRLLEVRAFGVTRVGATRTREIMQEAMKRFGE
jgi:deoxyribose-phosphate aldolase